MALTAAAPASKLRPALLAGSFIGVFSALPFVSAGNVCCCLWIVLGGVLAAWLLQQEDRTQPVTPGAGALAGAAAGMVGAFVYLAAGLVVMAVMRALLPSPFAAAGPIGPGTAGLPPELRDSVEWAQHAASGYAGVLLTFVFYLFVGTVFATMGGFVGALLLPKPRVVADAAVVAGPPIAAQPITWSPPRVPSPPQMPSTPPDNGPPSPPGAGE